MRPDFGDSARIEPAALGLRSKILGNPETAPRREVDEGHRRAEAGDVTRIFLQNSGYLNVIRAQQIDETRQEIIDFKAGLIDNGREPYGARFRHRIAPADRFPRQRPATIPLPARHLP